MSNNPRSVFLTGVTGVLGREIVRHYLTHTNDKLYLLIRRKNRYSHWDRARKILSGFGFEVFLGTRVQILEGDVTQPQLGLSEEDRKILRNEITHFYHIAALTALNGSREDCWQINVDGTDKALELAWDLRKSGRLERFYYYSTAYVAGSLQNYCSPEDSLPTEPGEAHANHYEASKCEAEKHVRRALAQGMPITIFRPSIVVGDSRTGEVSEFNVIYPFMKLFGHGILTTLPTKPENSFNIVPIDFVIQSSMAIAEQKDSIGKTYHLVTEEPPTISMLLRLREEYPGVPDIEVISPEDFSKDNLGIVEQNVYAMLSPYLGYLNGDLTFDTRNTRQALQGTGIEFPKTDYEFIKTLCRYAVEMGYLVIQ